MISGNLLDRHMPQIHCNESDGNQPLQTVFLQFIDQLIYCTREKGSILELQLLYCNLITSA